MKSLLILFAIFSPMILMAEEDSYVTKKINFEIHKITDTNNGKSSRGGQQYSGVYVSNTWLLFGELKILEVSSANKKITTIKNVTVEYGFNGIWVDVMVDEIGNRNLPISNFKGKALDDLFFNEFIGGKLNVGAQILFGASPNYSYLRNDKGLSIHDAWSWLIGGSAGARLMAGKISVNFNYNNESNVTITTGKLISGETILKEEFDSVNDIIYKEFN